MRKSLNFYPVILAGGRGTRFWPLSRKKRAKQLLALDGKHTMIQQTVARLLPLTPAKTFWIITNDDLRPAILLQEMRGALDAHLLTGGGDELGELLAGLRKREDGVEV